MYCSCGRKIKKNERFYIVRENEIFCKDCLEEEYVRVYRTNDGEDEFSQYEVNVFESMEEAIKPLQNKIDWFKHRLSSISNKPQKDEFDLVREKAYKIQIAELEEKIKQMKNDEE